MKTPTERQVAYWELHAAYDGEPRHAIVDDAVVLSNLTKGFGTSPGLPGLCIRYVAQGREDYIIGGRVYRLNSGHFLLTPRRLAAQVEITKRERSTTGLCVLLGEEYGDWLPGPVVVGETCSPLGPVMKDGVRRLWKEPRKSEIALAITGGLRSHVPLVASSLLQQSGALTAAKASTRAEMIRR